ncbi:hypothetical protein DL93DRAFT_1118380 [Clavulina sp. PMI_390]|nr:hypothetical protein DL93DRAFT_1118380 [Clavulina sp. PMI_390]
MGMFPFCFFIYQSQQMSTSVSSDRKIGEEYDPHRLIPTKLDTAIYNPAAESLDFLHATITKDDEELRRIIFDVQREAYVVQPFPCIARYGFLGLRLKSHPRYKEVLEMGRRDPSALLLDIGCCMGTDLRKAVFDGFPAQQAVGCDLYTDFFDHGHKLWSDKDSSAIKFIFGDVFSIPVPSSLPITPTAKRDRLTNNSAISKLEDLIGHAKLVYASAVFHLFSEAKQAEMARKVAVLASTQPGTIIFGLHVGSDVKGFEYEPPMVGGKMFCHSPESWRTLWSETYTELYGAQFAREHVKITATLVAGSMAANNPDPNRPPQKRLFWSIELV